MFMNSCCCNAFKFYKTVWPFFGQCLPDILILTFFLWLLRVVAVVGYGFGGVCLQVRLWFKVLSFA